MKNLDSSESSPERARANLIASAIALRDCSLRREISLPVRRACRVQMRVQAIKWRQLPEDGGLS